MIGEISQNFTEASASVGLILATALMAIYIKTQWKIVSSLGAEQVRFWKIKPRGILHS